MWHEIKIFSFPSERRAYGVVQNPSRTSPLPELRTAAPSMGRAPPGRNPADAVRIAPLMEGNEKS